VKKEISKAKMPQLGIYAALSFLLMMFNVPLIGGTTGHAVGGTLIAILMGPWARLYLGFRRASGTGSALRRRRHILAFGANCFNMAFVLPFVGYYIYKFVKERFNSKGGETAAIILGSYFGIVVASLCAAVEFGVQPLLFTDAAGQPLCTARTALPFPYRPWSSPIWRLPGRWRCCSLFSSSPIVKKVSPEMIDPAPAKKTKRRIWGLMLALICLTPAWPSGLRHRLGRVGSG
jgi:cobalt/nickel transport system permease protein